MHTKLSDGKGWGPLASRKLPLSCASMHWAVTCLFS